MKPIEYTTHERHERNVTVTLAIFLAALLAMGFMFAWPW
jgi:hypothetical protein